MERLRKSFRRKSKEKPVVERQEEMIVELETGSVTTAAQLPGPPTRLDKIRESQVPLTRLDKIRQSLGYGRYLPVCRVTDSVSTAAHPA